MERMFLVVIGFMLCFGNSNGQLWRQYNDSAKHYSDRRQPGKMLEFHIKIREELKKDSANTKTYAAYTNLLGSDYLDLADYEKAELFYLESKEIREKVLGKMDTVYASSCFNLGLVYKRMNQYEKAESFYLEAKNIWEKVKGKEDHFYARICNNLGNLYTDLHQYEKAELLLYESKTVREKLSGKDDPAYAQSILNLGALYANMNQYEKGEPLLLEAMQIREKKSGKESSEYAQASDNLGHLYLSLGQFKKAEPLFLEARQIWGKTVTKKHPNYALASNHLALLYMKMAEYEKAEPLFLEAKQIRERVSNKNLDYSWSCDNLAEYYKTTGQYEKAEPLFLESKLIREKILGKNHSDYGAACENLGNLYFAMEFYERAEPLYRETLEIRQNSNSINNLGMAYSYLNIGNVLSNTRQFEQAVLMYKKAREIAGKVNGLLSPEYASCCYNLAATYLDMGEYKKAEPLFLEAIQIRGETFGKDHPDYAQCLISLAVLYTNLNKYEKVNDYYAEAFQIQNNQWNKILRFTNEAEQQAYLKKRTNPVNLFLSSNMQGLSHSAQGLAYNIILSNRNLLLQSSRQLRQVIHNSEDTAIKNKYLSWINKREQLSFWLSKPLAEHPGYMKELEKTADLLEKELFSLSADFRKQEQQHKINWQDIQQSLKPGDVAIEFAEFPYFNGQRWTDSTYYVALVIHKNKPLPQSVYLAEKKQLETLLPKKSSGPYPSIDALYTSANIYKLVWEPLEKYLVNVSKVYFAPAGLLHKLNLANLSTGVNRILSDHYKLVQLNTTTSVTNLPPVFVTPKDDIILYGGVKFDADSTALKTAAKPYKFDIEKSIAVRGLDPSLGIPDLPYSGKEVDDIAKRAVEKKYTIKILKGVDANEESVKSLSGERSPAVLHLATHGKFFPEPKKINTNQQLSGGQIFAQSDNPLFRSVILMAGASSTWSGKPVSGIQNGILTAYEISSMYFPKTKMVVLSACETGLGDIEGSEGVYGLQRAFKIAGVQYLVMSLWKVPDNTTAEFMSEFYKTYFQTSRLIMHLKFRKHS